jgi:hypothetical protein
MKVLPGGASLGNGFFLENAPRVRLGRFYWGFCEGKVSHLGAGKDPVMCVLDRFLVPIRPQRSRPAGVVDAIGWIQVFARDWITWIFGGGLNPPVRPNQVGPAVELASQCGWVGPNDDLGLYRPVQAMSGGFVSLLGVFMLSVAFPIGVGFADLKCWCGGVGVVASFSDLAQVPQLLRLFIEICWGFQNLAHRFVHYIPH